MKYSLVSREVIADSIETVVGCQSYDGLIAIGGCDKNMPGLNRASGEDVAELRSIGELINREMLYTALTRAKKSVLILGEQSVLEEAAQYKVSRYSGIGTALASKEKD